MSELQTGYRERVTRLEEGVRALPGALSGQASEAIAPVEHRFENGFYLRELSCPAGVMAVTKIHKHAHPFFLMEGDVSVLTEDGMVRIKAPYAGITKPGTKRVVYTHADTRWVTAHETDEVDVDRIEAAVIAKDFGELEVSEEDMEQLMGASECRL